VKKGDYAAVLSSIGDLNSRLGLFEQAIKNYDEVRFKILHSEKKTKNKKKKSQSNKQNNHIGN